MRVDEGEQLGMGYLEQVMQERAQAIGAQLQIYSQPGRSAVFSKSGMSLSLV